MGAGAVWAQRKGGGQPLQPPAAMPKLTQKARKAAQQARKEACCVPHCEEKGVVAFCHQICFGCLWGCTKAQCDDGLPFYKCPMCRKKIMLPMNAHHDLMMKFCSTKECIKESCCDGPRYQWKLEPCANGCTRP